MELRTFTDNFNLLAEAPNGIPRLREMILQLAVRGKLLPQDLKDEPASVLLEKIDAEKETLIAEGKIKGSRSLPPIGPDEVPYNLPNSWQWSRIREITYELGQQKPDAPFTYIDVTTIDNKIGKISESAQILAPADAPSRARKLVASGSVIYSTVRPYLLNIAIVDRDFDPKPIVSTAFAVLHPFSGIANRFLYHYLRSKPFIDYVNRAMTGMAYPAINDSKMALGIVPLPPLAEQKRIVAKVDELMALCDELEEQKKRRGHVSVSMNTACLHEMTSSEPVISQKGWARIRENFDLLYDTPENVAALRQSILQLAVMGSLVPQDPNDEPASVLLEKIAAEKERLITEGKIKQSKPLPVVEPDEVPYKLPEEWEWVRLGNLIHVSSGDALPTYDMAEGPIPVFGGNGITGYHNQWNVKHPTVVIGRVGFYCGSIHETPGAAWVTDNAFVTTFPERYLFRPFLVWLLKATDLQKNTSSTAQPVISGRKIYPLIVPLPPLAEQKRIVAKVDELMALCDGLETRLRDCSSVGDKLMQAVVNQVIEKEREYAWGKSIRI